MKLRLCKRAISGDHLVSNTVEFQLRDTEFNDKDKIWCVIVAPLWGAIIEPRRMLLYEAGHWQGRGHAVYVGGDA